MVVMVLDDVVVVVDVSRTFPVAVVTSLVVMVKVGVCGAGSPVGSCLCKIYEITLLF